MGLVALQNVRKRQELTTMSTLMLQKTQEIEIEVRLNGILS
jgi:hypothetical protein